METALTKILLRNLSNQQTQGFDPEHAEAILAYPNGGWARVSDETTATTTGDGSGTTLPPGDNTEKTAAADGIQKTPASTKDKSKAEKGNG